MSTRVPTIRHSQLTTHCNLTISMSRTGDLLHMLHFNLETSPYIVRQSSRFIYWLALNLRSSSSFSTQELPDLAKDPRLRHPRWNSPALSLSSSTLHQFFPPRPQIHQTPSKSRSTPKLGAIRDLSKQERSPSTSVSPLPTILGSARISYLLQFPTAFWIKVYNSKLETQILSIAMWDAVLSSVRLWAVNQRWMMGRQYGGLACIFDTVICLWEHGMLQVGSLKSV